MSYANQSNSSDRAKSLVVVAVIHAALSYVLVSGMGVDLGATVNDGFKVINITPKPQSEELPMPLEEPAAADEGVASPKNLEAKPTQIIAPEPEVKLKKKSPVIAAPKAGTGNENSAGLSDRIGPDNGGGGRGDGLGSGRRGSGPGGIIASKPHHKSGAITRGDIPRAVWKAANRGDVIAHFTVQPNGRATGCRIKRSSGYLELDATTCRLIETRLRFEPARNKRGDAVAHPYGWKQEWWEDWSR